ncbi:MAG TPA: hypothetical protein VGA21_11290, partial [Cyclobacteriaceae bacterium]
NEDYQMTHGEIVTVHNPDSPFVYDGRKDRTETTETTTTTSTSSATTTAIASTEITIENEIDSVFINDDGKIVVLDTAGNATTHEIPKDENGEDKAVTITDSAGNSYTVEGGEVKKGVSGEGNTPVGNTEEERNLTGLDSLVYAAIIHQIEASEATIDSIKGQMQPFIEAIEGIIESENFYPPRIRGENDELIGEGISLHIAIVDKPENIRSRLSQSVKSIDEARNHLIQLDIPIQELKPTIELLNELKEGEPFEELVESIRNDSGLPESSPEKIKYIEGVINQRINENEE